MTMFKFRRLLLYHVMVDCEVEEDDRLLDSNTIGKMFSRSQQDQNIAAKVVEFTSNFQTQALAFNIINRKRALGEFLYEESSRRKTRNY
ncbi:uncharacterized protein [Spinacia oleracea]|uniref:Uncharacterized protein isoform X2 n=1 Tax=Spinacia oleracea TaxID=3562 RepID=A0ABM3RKT7_SPIOL|nr:uncharacterized protein LOC130470312 isoform X2 [Spinacia oleracea]